MGSLFSGPQVMLDLETLGQKPGSVIFSIGACRFDEKGVDEEGAFYTKISPQSCVDAGLTLDVSTVVWWMGQSDDARKELIAAEKGGPSLREALVEFTKWLAPNASAVNNTCIWGNGSDFDNTMLVAAYQAVGDVPIPWRFFNNRCYRTMKNMRPGIPLQKRLGTHHNALNDAVTQAHHLLDILTK